MQVEASLGHGAVPTTGGLYDRRGPIHVRVGQVAFQAVDSPELLGGFVVTGQHDGHRHRLLALPQVVAGRLARDRGITPDSENVVNRLEGQAQLAAVRLQGIDVVPRCAGQDRSDRCRVAEQGTGLVGLHGQAGLQVDPCHVVKCHVSGLSCDHRRRGRSKARGGRDPLLRRVVQEDLVGEVVERIAGDDGVLHPERGPDGRSMPTDGVAIDDVVMDEREVVHQLRRHRPGDRCRSGGTDSLGGEDGEGRPEALARPCV